MRGRSHAVGATIVSTSLPLLNWLGTAIVGLVILRKGPVEGLMVLIWALLPLGIALYLIGDPSPVIAMLGTAILANVLRVTVSWEITLTIAVLVSALGSLVFELTATEVLAVIVEWYLEYTRLLAGELKQTQPVRCSRRVRTGVLVFGVSVQTATQKSVPQSVNVQ